MGLELNATRVEIGILCYLLLGSLDHVTLLSPCYSSTVTKLPVLLSKVNMSVTGESLTK